MKYKEIKLSNGKEIHIYDGLFTYAEMEYFFKFITQSFFRWGGDDGPMSDMSDQIYSEYSIQDIERMGFMRSKGFEFLKSKHKTLERNPDAIRINLSPPFENCVLHTDTTEGLTLLYYTNLKWETNWNGHTLFMDDHLEDAEHICLYKPGRIVLFDGSIPHMIMTQVPRHRFSFVLQYDKK